MRPNKHSFAAPIPQRVLPIQRFYDEALRHHAEGHLREAELGYRKILSMAPNHADSLHLLGLVAHQTGHRSEAEALIRKAIALKSNCADYHSNLGNVLQVQGRLEEAAACYRKALAFQPTHSAARNNLGGALLALGRTEEAIGCYGKVLAAAPHHAGALHNLGTALYAAGRLDDSIACYEQALAIAPDHAKTHLDLAHALLKKGDFARGWREYEWRRQIPLPKEHQRNFTQPRWQGEPLKGRRILIYTEQGLGDCIQLLRYLPLLRATGARIVLEVPGALARLAGQIEGIDELAIFGRPLPEFDFQCPLMSLARIFAADLNTIPATTPYLSVPEPVRQQAAAFAWPPTGLRVGLAWAGNGTHHNNRFRSMPFSALAPLFAVEDAHFFSLQADQPARERLPEAPVTDLLPQIRDMADTAALIEQLDLVIAVDTSVAHLAGALGKPVWILLPDNADWRWMVEREDSPWYPTARLFRQNRLGDWPTLITRVAASLASLVRDHALKPYSETRVDVSRKQGIQVDATIREWRPYTTLDRTQ